MHVSIRPATEEDIPAFVRCQADPEAAAMAAFSTPATADERSARWRDVLADPNARLLAIISDDTVTGFAGAFTREGDREVTYWVAREHWGRGIATRALALLLREEDQRPIFARVAADNFGSQAVLRKCGFTMTGTARGHEIEERIYRLDTGNDAAEVARPA